MKDPREALEEARRASALAGPDEPPPSLELGFASARRLAEWAIIEPDESKLYSTRLYGKPITALKRLFVRFLRQYFDQVTAQQSRFNAHLAAHVLRLEERVAALEQAAGQREHDPERPR